ncbi:alkaline phosphatase family protein [Rubritalea marina]|uniref:alkaline phosphatase family protein n=1 Tax=Rubritalea marina TaxID=361055 RepID=UPI00039A1F75|nr:alkaline phosphatase family protein [Rubritalea marina]
MKDRLSLFIMIDACGWEIVRDRPFLSELAPHRRKLESVFGYSSTCVPSILSGHWPDEHYNWCYFVYDPKNSPFRPLRMLRWLPTFITSRRIARRVLTKFVKRSLGFRGYFDLYNIPFKYIHLFDFTEKKSPLKPEGMNRGTNIFDTLEAANVPYYVTDTLQPEEEHLRALKADIESERIDFAFQYWAGLDGLLHMVGNDSPEIPLKLDHYEKWIGEVMDLAKKHYKHVDLHVFSDHGMANCDVLLDLRAKVDELGLKFGVDYAVVYDSTMARFWFLKPGAREKIEALLDSVPEGRTMPKEELQQYRAYFDGGEFGELIWLAEEGTLIVPSHMGERPIRAMHGYHPTDPQSYATLFSNTDQVPDEVTHIPHICKLMENAVSEHAKNK